MRSEAVIGMKQPPRTADISNFAVLTAVFTLILMTLGGAVHATGSSLACPDWPLCYGQAFPEMVGGILYEHSHRLLGTNNCAYRNQITSIINVGAR